MSASTVYGVNETLRLAGTLIDYQKVGGKAKVLTERYYSTAIEALSTITCPKIPKGAVIIGGWLSTEALGTGATMTVKAGDTAISSALAVATAGVHSLDKIYALDNGPLTADTQITIYTGGATLTADKEILLTILYTTP
jgi:hypothetical protein